MAQKDSTEVLSLRVSKKEKMALEALAHATQRPRQALLNEALDRYLNSESWQVAAIEEGLQAADAGDFVADEDVRAWLEGWGSDGEGKAPV